MEDGKLSKEIILHGGQKIKYIELKERNKIQNMKRENRAKEIERKNKIRHESQKIEYRELRERNKIQGMKTENSSSIKEIL